mmetsp:Transcript_903/g.2749  ORF Transcript_903/g.2749 Transcript_903/m.2749 type:complete len:230 (+) Transcript_903:456-1145(+)
MGSSSGGCPCSLWQPLGRPALGPGFLGDGGHATSSGCPPSCSSGPSPARLRAGPSHACCSRGGDPLRPSRSSPQGQSPPAGPSGRRGAASSQGRRLGRRRPSRRQQGCRSRLEQRHPGPHKAGGPLPGRSTCSPSTGGAATGRQAAAAGSDPGPCGPTQLLRERCWCSHGRWSRRPRRSRQRRSPWRRPRRVLRRTSRRPRRRRRPWSPPTPGLRRSSCSSGAHRGFQL